eukprot:1540624-Amphidinium_carterae.1
MELLSFGIFLVQVTQQEERQDLKQDLIKKQQLDKAKALKDAAEVIADTEQQMAHILFYSN